MKKTIALALTLTLLVSCLFGCSSAPASSGNSSSAPTPSDGQSTSSDDSAGPIEKVEIELWHYYATANGENFQKMIDEYNALPEGKAKVKALLLPRNELLKKYSLGVVSGDLPDMALCDNPDTSSLAAMGLFADVTERFAAWEDNKFAEGPLNSGRYQDKQYAIPLRSNCLAFWVNNDMIASVGVTEIPKTWDELKALCAKLKVANPAVYPLAFSAIKSEEGVFQFMPFFQSTGATYKTADSAEGVRAFQFISDLVTNGYVSTEIINWGQGDVEKQFASGNAAMMIAGGWHIANVAVDAPDMKYTIGMIPMDKEYSSSLGGENIGITKAAKNVDACWDFIEWFVGTENNVRFNVMGGTISPHSNVTPEDQYPNDEKMIAFLDQFQYASSRGPHPKWTEISTAFQTAIQETLIGAKTPEVAAKDAAAKITAIDASVK